VPDEIFKGSHFERRFVTPFGHVWEKLALVAAAARGAQARTNHSITGQIRQGRLERIQETPNNLEHKIVNGKRVKPNWRAELDYIHEGTGEALASTVVCDVFVKTPENESLAIELKAPLPNSDQTKVSKEKLLKLYAMEPRQITQAYFALPYNPYGKREDYSWSFPARWFDMVNDPVVLIGEPFWNLIGGIGTYEEFIDAVNEIGKQYKTRIYRQYLAMEPPEAQFGLK